MGIQGGPDIIEEGLVLYLDAAYKRSYPGSGTTWTDIGGSNNGTISGAVYSNGSFDFDGVNNDVVSVGNSFIKNNDNITLEVFFNHDSNGDLKFALYEGEGDGFGGNVEFHLGLNNSGYLQVFLMATPALSLSGSAILTPGTWNYGAVVYENLSTPGSASSKLYHNGILVNNMGSATVDKASLPTSNFLIGKPFDPTRDRRWDGKIAIVRIYNRALSSTEVSQNFNVLQGRFGI